MRHLDLVADVGNTRIKWGRCGPGAILAGASLPPDNPELWQAQLENWEQSGSLSWAVAGVHPQRLDHFVDWARRRGDAVRVIDDWQQLPLRVLLAEPQKV